MTPTLPGSYEFKGVLYSQLGRVYAKDYPDWTRAEVYSNEEGRLCAKALDEDGHYSAAFLIQFNGQWRQPL